jgi:rhodanese-related sulfurtransferase
VQGPSWIEGAVAFILFDLWMYLWHRANHTNPLLWRFHRMHHSELQLDATSAVRFHPGEIFLSGIARIVVVPLFGMTMAQLIVYESALFPIIVLHHSNVRLPRWLDHGLLALFVTPAMHRVHHSRWRPETDSNYGSVFPYWDRLFRSFRLRADAREVELGLDEFAEPRWQTMTGLLATPFESRPRPARESDDATRMTPAELQSKLRSDKPPIVIDIRSPEAFAKRHIPGARNIALEDLVAAARDLPPGSAAVVYCNLGFKSRRAASDLRKMAVDARDLVGGFRAWKGPVESRR